MAGDYENTLRECRRGSCLPRRNASFRALRWIGLKGGVGACRSPSPSRATSRRSASPGHRAYPTLLPALSTFSHPLRRCPGPIGLALERAFTCTLGRKRRGWDSNPRDDLTPPTRFPIALLRPTRTPLRKRRTGVY